MITKLYFKVLIEPKDLLWTEGKRAYCIHIGHMHAYNSKIENLNFELYLYTRAPRISSIYFNRNTILANVRTLK